MTDRQRNGLILLIIVGLIAASGVIIAAKKTILGLDLRGGIELVYQAQGTPRDPHVTAQSLSQAVNIMRNRVDQLGVAQPQISTVGRNLIDVQLPGVPDVQRAESEVGQTAELYFYDWEANALTPNGQTVASQLTAQNSTAVTVSQGASNEAPGSGSAGGMTLYQAVKLAQDYKNPPIGKFNSHILPEYFAFGAPGSSACQTAAKFYGYVPASGSYCYLGGGQGETLTSLKQTLAQDGIPLSQAQILDVPRGMIVLQAVPSSFSSQPKIYNPSTRFFTLLDRAALTGGQINNPQESTDPTSGQPDVQFGLTSRGQTAFQNTTSAIAHRGQLVSIGSQKLYQHFAVSLDGTLLTVPQINFNQYPDGIIGSSSEITGGFTANSASNLATELRLGALPVTLTRISTQQVSATLGHQALNQGLLALAVGLGVVALFLLVFYRVLGLIAIGGLAVYALYFYALIKLIPVTMTLAGIAGLILTIGVAADANIVVFERVKEEIRAGRSIRQGIVTGYKKGLTAIIDANVVTIITAFILFVLATSDVKGFALTLGVGTMVSLFTAVMATQAILTTMGDSRVIRRPSALGAGGGKHQWRIDFMGRSKYFFTLSGVILLVGALAIGARGLNLGIDFTSGTQATFGLSHHATQSQVQSYLSSQGIRNLSVQAVSNHKTLGQTGFQIAFNKWTQHGKPVPGPQQQHLLQSALQSRWGIARNGADFNYTSVGPTFGSDVAHSAIVAIIISLIVISIYVALRFAWKFAVPVLIALMHDLLITSGVYALTGRTVSADTVAALLTILGYSMYDTIIVFDRIRENIPRMPRAAFSQIVNRAMSEVLTRSLATTSVTLLPVIALLIFGGTTLKDFAFALLIGVASGAYSSIFIASPVLTHWKEREAGYSHRRERIIAELGHVPAYATLGADVEPDRRRAARQSRRISDIEPDLVSEAEFEQMKRDLAIELEEEQPTGRHTSTLTRRLAHQADLEADAPPTALRRGPAGKGHGRARTAGRRPAPRAGETPPAPPRPAPEVIPPPAPEAARRPEPESPLHPEPDATPRPEPEAAPPHGEETGGRLAPAGPAGEGFEHAPDEAENEGMMPDAPKPKPPPRQRPRNRRHGRRR
jgi:SecD/SecF fusion protein